MNGEQRCATCGHYDQPARWRLEKPEPPGRWGLCQIGDRGNNPDVLVAVHGLLHVRPDHGCRAWTAAGVHVMPQRIQLSRRKGWRLPDGAVKVDRSTKWGNPYRVATGCQNGDVANRAVASLMFAVLVQDRRDGAHPYPSLDEIQAELAGRDLACWCPLPAPGEPDWCHAAVLLRLANGGDA